jgi:precorrin-6x reductase
VVKDAIAIARQKGTRVLAAVGGATFNGWSALNTRCIAKVVDYFGL